MRLVSVFVLSSLLLGGGAALAGEKVGGTVSVSTTSRYAAGGLGAARNSTDTVQYIGCMVQANGTAAPLAVCYARSAAGVSGLCTSEAPGIVANAQSVSGDSWLSFYWDTAGKCTQVAVYNKSSLEPKR